MAELSTTARVNAQEVRDIIETELSNEQINAHINTATLMVDALSGLSDPVEKNVELWLSAHFVAITDPELKSESIGGEFSVSLNVGTPGSGLKATRFGEQAMFLDSSGGLAGIGKRKAVLSVILKDAD